MIYAEFGFGKYAGKTPDEVPVDYLRWALGSVDDLDPDLETAIRASLQKRGGGFGGHSQQSGNSHHSRNTYPPPPAALPVGVSIDIAAELVREGRRAMALKYHPDRQNGDAERMTRANATADHLEKRLRIILGIGGSL